MCHSYCGYSWTLFSYFRQSRIIERVQGWTVSVYKYLNDQPSSKGYVFLVLVSAFSLTFGLSNCNWCNTDSSCKANLITIIYNNRSPTNSWPIPTEWRTWWHSQFWLIKLGTPSVHARLKIICWISWKQCHLLTSMTVAQSYIFLTYSPNLCFFYWKV